MIDPALQLHHQPLLSLTLLPHLESRDQTKCTKSLTRIFPRKKVVGPALQLHHLLLLSLTLLTHLETRQNVQKVPYRMSLEKL